MQVCSLGDMAMAAAMCVGALPRPCSLPRFRRIAQPACVGVQCSVGTSVEKGQVEALWSWLQAKGAVGEAVRPALVAEGLGLVAQREVTQGEEVVSVPEALWMNLAAAQASPIGPFCQGLKPWMAIALFILYEKSQSVSSWRPYLDNLPQILDSPLFWSEEELLELQGTQLLGSVVGYKDYVESEFNSLLEDVIRPNPQVFHPDIFTMEAFLWAFGILRSRTFAPLTGDDLALVPLADLVNHGPGVMEDTPSWAKKNSGLFWNANKKGQTVVVRAPINFHAGEQVYMQYGKSKSNAELALDYGFVESDLEAFTMESSGREALALTLEICEGDRYLDDKLDIAELNGLERSVQFDLQRGQGPPDTMLTFLRLTALTGPDAFLLEALFRNAVWSHLTLPVSRDNEEGVCVAMLDGCQAALAGYHTTAEEDTQLLEGGGLSRRREIAVVVRLGEKRVLQELQTWFEERMAGLDALEYYAERRLKDLGLLDDTGFMTPWVLTSRQQYCGRCGILVVQCMKCDVEGDTTDDFASYSMFSSYDAFIFHHYSSIESWLRWSGFFKLDVRCMFK